MGRNDVAKRSRITQRASASSSDPGCGTQVLLSARDIGVARSRLAGLFEEDCHYVGVRALGYSSWDLKAAVYWSEKHRLWASFPPLQGKKPYYLNLFGQDDPRKVDRLAIAAQANPPSSGESKSLQGVFVREGTGGIVLLHRGRFTVTRRAVTTQQCLDTYQGEKLPLNGAQVLVVARLDERDVVGQCAQWVYEVAKMKDELRSAADRRDKR